MTGSNRSQYTDRETTDHEVFMKALNKRAMQLKRSRRKRNKLHLKR